MGGVKTKLNARYTYIITLLVSDIFFDVTVVLILHVIKMIPLVKSGSAVHVVIMQGKRKYFRYDSEVRQYHTFSIVPIGQTLNFIEIKCFSEYMCMEFISSQPNPLYYLPERSFISFQNFNTSVHLFVHISTPELWILQ